MNRPIDPDIDDNPRIPPSWSWQDIAAELRKERRRYAEERTENRKLRAALQEIAKQKILDEVEDPVCADYEDGYTTCVEVARAAIKGENANMEARRNEARNQTGS